jgi:hypothetical protein
LQTSLVATNLTLGGLQSFCSCFLTRYPYILSEVQSLHLSRLTSSMLPSQNKKLPTDS